MIQDIKSPNIYLYIAEDSLREMIPTWEFDLIENNNHLIHVACNQNGWRCNRKVLGVLERERERASSNKKILSCHSSTPEKFSSLQSLQFFYGQMYNSLLANYSRKETNVIDLEKGREWEKVPAIDEERELAATTLGRRWLLCTRALLEK